MPFWSRRAPAPEISYGASFHRRRDHETVETARVIAVSDDATGIPHVYFNLSISGPRVQEEERRTLSLEYFHRLYGQAVPA
jgi:hypothetical protein